MKPVKDISIGVQAIVRSIFVVLLVLSSFALSSIDAVAQPFPSKRVTLLVPYAPGGIVDLIARMLVPRLSERFGQSVVVENRPSVSGNVGAAAGAQAAPDGYTVTVLVTTNLIASMTASQPPFNMEKDFAPVTELVRYYSMLVVKPSIPAKDVAELIALAKAQPGRLNNGSSGVGSSPHIAMGLLAQATGMDVLHVPYKGEGPLITALLTGEIDMTFLTLSGAGTQLKAGKVRGLGVTSMKRIAQFPDVPAISETLPGFEYLAWVGAAVPAATPRERIDLLYKEIAAALQTPEVRQNLLSRSFEMVGSTPDQFRQRIRSDTDVLGRLIKTLGIKTE